LVEHNGVKTETDVSFYFKTWTRLGIEYAAPTGDPAIALSNVKLLERVKSNPYTLEVAVNELNKTFRDRAVAEINIQDLRVALTLAGGEILNDLIENSKL
jgi:exopolysaccharide biosynthesis predicted pyruvyltransferase EpsI